MPRAPIVIVFGRLPTVDAVKTRLAAGIGREEATAHYCAFARATFCEVERYCASRSASWVFYYARGSADEALGWLSSGGESYTHLAGCRSQSGETLGDRMINAFCEVMGPSPSGDGTDGGVGALVIGTDAPDIRSRHLSEAADTLGVHAAVIGPARDGGFWLLGLRDRPSPSLMRGIEWSTERTRAQLLGNAQAEGLDVAPPDALPTLADVDVAEDLEAWRERSRPFCAAAAESGDRGTAGGAPAEPAHHHDELPAPLKEFLTSRLAAGGHKNG